MHDKSIDESEGTFEDGWNLSPRPCPYCKAEGQRYYRTWESDDGAYEDEKNECRACKRTWWIEGPDA